MQVVMWKNKVDVHHCMYMFFVLSSSFILVSFVTFWGNVGHIKLFLIYMRSKWTSKSEPARFVHLVEGYMLNAHYVLVDVEIKCLSFVVDDCGGAFAASLHMYNIVFYFYINSQFRKEGSMTLRVFLPKKARIQTYANRESETECDQCRGKIQSYWEKWIYSKHARMPSIGNLFDCDWPHICDT